VYHYFLIFHSYYRWAVLFALVSQLIWLYINQRNNTIFQIKHYQLVIVFTFIYNIQFVLGWLLYLNSPLVTGFWSDIASGVKNRQLRFFGLEHMFMMTLAVLLINVFTLTVKSKINKNGFRYLWKRYIWITLIIISSIPWSFSPLTSRPNLR
jgi:hypothetical protein